MVALVALTACGGDNTPPSPGVLATKIGCTDVEASTGSQMELGAREEVTCSLGDERLTILTYASNEPRDTAQEIAANFGGITVLGDRFAVRVDTQATAERVQEAVGGEIR